VTLAAGAGVSIVGDTWTAVGLYGCPSCIEGHSRDTARAMSQENLEALRSAFEAWARDALDPFAGHCAEDIRDRMIAGGREYATKREAIEAAGLKE
jgi:hypothetical protein